MLASLLASPAAAAGAGAATGTQAVADATVRIAVGNLRGGRAEILSTVPVQGTLSPFVPGQRVEVTFFLDGRRLLTRQLAVRKGRGDSGIFSTGIVVREDGRYAVSATHRANAQLGGDSTVRKRWRVSFPDLHAGQCGRVVRAFRAALSELGYANGRGSCFTGRVGREVLAYRKVNGMTPNRRAGAGLLRDVFAGRGAYRVRYPKAGEHAEAPLDRQVLVLVKRGRPFAVYPVSTGKASTPTITGHFAFYRREPGYNAKGMYYSFYWHNGYAVHGYASVPSYPASHGCIRTFLADQPRIYEQLHYGEAIFVF